MAFGMMVALNIYSLVGPFSGVATQNIYWLCILTEITSLLFIFFFHCSLFLFNSWPSKGRSESDKYLVKYIL